MAPGRMDQPVCRQFQRLLAGTLPPEERHGRVEQTERDLQQRKGRVAAGDYRTLAAAGQAAILGGVEWAGRSGAPLVSQTAGRDETRPGGGGTK